VGVSKKITFNKIYQLISPFKKRTAKRELILPAVFSEQQLLKITRNKLTSQQVSAVPIKT
jgi:hypothetical protein